MIGLLNHLAEVFGFSQYTTVIVAVSLTAMLVCLCGGIVGSMLQAFSGAIRPVSLSQKTSFRLIIILEISLLGFASYYHGLMIGELQPSHIVFWVFTLLAVPVMGVIGAQIGYLLFRQKIDANIKLGLARQRDRRRRA